MKNSLNEIILIGTIEKKLESFIHKDIKFNQMLVSYERPSGVKDILKVVYLDESDQNFNEGDFIKIDGKLQTRNVHTENTKTKIEIFIQANSIIDLKDVKDFFEKANVVTLKGTICKPVIYRITPLHKELVEIILAVNDSYNRSYYIPVIAFYQLAQKLKDLKVGDQIHINGRFQSREYHKPNDPDNVIRTAYEVVTTSVENIYLV